MPSTFHWHLPPSYPLYLVSSSDQSLSILHMRQARMRQVSASFLLTLGKPSDLLHVVPHEFNIAILANQSLQMFSHCILIILSPLLLWYSRSRFSSCTCLQRSSLLHCAVAYLTSLKHLSPLRLLLTSRVNELWRNDQGKYTRYL